MSAAKSYAIFFSIIAATVGLIAGLRATTHGQPTAIIQAAAEQTKTPPQNPYPLATPLSLKQKVGQLFMVGIPGTTIDATAHALLTQYYVGGIFLLGKNIESPQQLLSLTTTAQHQALYADNAIPLFIATDQEGGEASRISFGAHAATPQSAITDTIQAYILARERGEALKQLGINTNFSPVVDSIHSSSSFLFPRTFHVPDNQIASLASAMIRGYQEAGIIAVAKHFPGHTDQAQDPHLTASYSAVSTTTLQENEQPFQKLIAISHPLMMMVDHVIYTHIDPQNPASMSPTIIRTLRTDMGYQNIIITDDMEMAAVTQHTTSLSDAVIQALKAGADIVLLSGFTVSPQEHEAVIQAVQNAVQNGIISESTLNQKVERILEIKKQALAQTQENN